MSIIPKGYVGLGPEIGWPFRYEAVDELRSSPSMFRDRRRSSASEWVRAKYCGCSVGETSVELYLAALSL